MRQILEKLLNGKISLEEAEKLINSDHIREVEDFAKFDMHRESRTGFPEAIYAPGKKDSEIIKIIMHCVDNGHMMVTQLEKERYDNIKTELTSLKEQDFKIKYHERARILVIKKDTGEKYTHGKIGIITAGTSDIPVGEEARIVAEESGCEVITSYDVGVAGIHRLFSHLSRMLEEKVQVIIVVAGMEGALPSVVAGMVDIPVVGVPTSVGYGVGKDGFTALYCMLQSCAPGIAVVNIDNGFGAAVFAVTVVKQCKKHN
ncbi:nickel pincer cofactor biosynthesis protein LarB [Methanobacterium alcaliphilum]|uniref:nickel pincer cofactor biosynthesis protein LarB n=1 Tax=Methanobacterium alcaliphilum TaxID=392018 RepID=UPI00200A7A5B|nr:nickel pincer cofactor biosynthesis protein LarB [Methanobacterium alcaliphilum]MCK9152557.1 nickel pincer cofactor biosynthesis protein LarB [Methanobacterium alcaliphilum]